MLPPSLRGAAAAGFVLARNEGQVLPLQRDGLRRVAVLGPNAAAARTLGGGSATVFPSYTVSPLDGLRSALGDDVDVTYGSGGRSTDRLPVAPAELLTLPDGTGPGLEIRAFGMDGALRFSEHRGLAALTWMGAFGPELQVREASAVEVHTRLRVPAAGTYLVGASGLGRFRLTVDGETVLDTEVALPPNDDPVEAMMRPPQASASLDLSAGQEVALVLHHEPQWSEFFDAVETSMLMIQLNLVRQVPDDDELARAVALAADADVAVVVVGTTEEVESEGFDRVDLALPGRQDELVHRVAAANPRTVVVVNAGAPVLLPWADEVAAVLLAWFTGQEFGNALADVLLGDTEPGGRLPTTWPMAEEGLPPVSPVDGTLPYDEGLFVGYRAFDRDGRTPRYAFGHGLGYTEWSYDAVEAPARAAAGEPLTVRVAVRNTGARPGREVVQVYASRPDSSVERPLRWLAGYASVTADPGQDAHVDVTLAARAFEHWDVERSAWTVEPGTFTLHAGSSSRQLPLEARVGIARRG